MRGRLINAFVIELRQLDTMMTEFVPGGGYDPDFQEPRSIHDTTVTGADTRRETPLRLSAQIEAESFNAASVLSTGQVRLARFVCVCHFRDLENQNLLDDTGQPRIRVGDRLEAIFDQNLSLIMRIPNPPGLYVRETRPVGFGMVGGQRNLLQLEFRSREQAR